MFFVPLKTLWSFRKETYGKENLNVFTIFCYLCFFGLTMIVASPLLFTYFIFPNLGYVILALYGFIITTLYAVYLVPGLHEIITQDDDYNKRLFRLGFVHKATPYLAKMNISLQKEPERFSNVETGEELQNINYYYDFYGSVFKDKVEILGYTGTNNVEEDNPYGYRNDSPNSRSMKFELASRRIKIGYTLSTFVLIKEFKQKSKYYSRLTKQYDSLPVNLNVVLISLSLQEAKKFFPIILKHNISMEKFLFFLDKRIDIDEYENLKDFPLNWLHKVYQTT